VNRALMTLFLVWGLAAGACSAPSPPILERPFTADQIREAWGAGLVLDLRHSDSDGVVFERWTVVATDLEGAEIEYRTIDEDGASIGEPRRARSGWDELRDHASFPADLSRREETTLQTPLGPLEGWLYSVQDPQAGTQTEFFFAHQFPGAPVQMRVTRGGELIAEMVQFSRGVR